MAFNGVVREKGSWIATDNDDNALSTATKAAPPAGLSHHITSISGGYSATVSGNTLILKDGSTEVGRWYVYDSFALVFPSPVQINGVANLELAASGTGGTVGAATMTGYTL